MLLLLDETILFLDCNSFSNLMFWCVCVYTDFELAHTIFVMKVA